MAPKKRILSIDGGGIRSIIPAQILVGLEEKLRKKAKNKHASIADYFDMIAGTNGGGVLTFAYLLPDDKKPQRPAYTAQQVMDIYLKRGHHIFHYPFGKRVFGRGNDIYPAKGSNKILSNYFGDRRLSELLKPCLVPTYNVNERKTLFLNQERVHQDQLDDFRLRDVARAATATPGFFNIANIESLGGRHYPLLDGNIYANNPSMCAYAEAQRQIKDPREKEENHLQDIAILSLGTGSNEAGYQYEDVKTWRHDKWTKPLIRMIMSSGSETVDKQLEQLYHSVNAEDQYVRINPELKMNMDASLDNASSRNRKALRKLGEEALNQNNSELDRVAEQLVQSQKDFVT